MIISKIAKPLKIIANETINVSSKQSVGQLYSPV